MRLQASGGFFLEAVGLEDAKGLISELDHELKQGLRDRLKEAAGIVSREAAGLTTSARVRSGMSTTVRVWSLADFEARIGPSRKKAWFAHFLEFGTRPHQVAKGAQTLSLRGDGRVRRREKNVAGSRMHPGGRAFPFLAPALAATEDQVVEMVGFPAVLSPHSGGSK